MQQHYATSHPSLCRDFFFPYLPTLNQYRNLLEEYPIHPHICMGFVMVGFSTSENMLRCNSVQQHCPPEKHKHQEGLHLITPIAQSRSIIKPCNHTLPEAISESLRSCIIEELWSNNSKYVVLCQSPGESWRGRTGLHCLARFSSVGFSLFCFILHACTLQIPYTFFLRFACCSKRANYSAGSLIFSLRDLHTLIAI